jgi:hypothetical protein
MINEPTTPTSVTNQQTLQTGVINKQITPRANSALWLFSTLPWQLDEPWEFKTDVAYNTLVTNQTI